MYVFHVECGWSPLIISLYCTLKCRVSNLNLEMPSSAGRPWHSVRTSPTSRTVDEHQAAKYTLPLVFPLENINSPAVIVDFYPEMSKLNGQSSSKVICQTKAIFARSHICLLN